MVFHKEIWRAIHVNAAGQIIYRLFHADALWCARIVSQRARFFDKYNYTLFSFV